MVRKNSSPTETPSFRKNFFNLLFFGGLVLAAPAFADIGSVGSDYLPLLETGVDFYTGNLNKSLAGSHGYLLSFGAEKKRNFFRPDVAAEFQFGKGLATLSGATPSYTLYGTVFDLGARLFFTSGSRFTPFFGAGGVIAWHLFQTPASPSPGVDPSTEGLSYGFEATAGVDMRLWSREGNAIRLRGAYRSVSSKLGGISGFELNSFRFTIGVVY